MPSKKKTKAAQDTSPKIDADSMKDFWEELKGIFNNIITSLDEQDAIKCVQEMRVKYPDADLDTLVKHLINDKCKKIVGMRLTPAAADDIKETFKLQAELVLEIGVAHGRTLSEEEKPMAVMLITGMNAGVSQIAKKTFKHLSEQYAEKILQHLDEKYAEKLIAPALAVAGVAASAALNALATYVVGHRAHAYFSPALETTGDLGPTRQIIPGLDVAAVGSWLEEQTHTSWQTVHTRAAAAATTIAHAGHAASSKVVSGASTTAGYLTSGASAAGNAVVSSASSAGTAVVSGAHTAAEYVAAGASSTRDAALHRASVAADYASVGVSAVGGVGKKTITAVGDRLTRVKQKIGMRKQPQLDQPTSTESLQDDDTSATPPASPDT